ncbi:hypothetical protein SLS60_000531 [Paraconiothyrium brasiliense]|uniref:Uncharacterized protein n=1 Tax=Paraconiothyrium brasiliense TaxID=300254 RepID=A0ABR3S6Q2_9PLEO
MARIYALRQGRCVANAFPQTGQSSESSRSGIRSGTAQHDHPPTSSESNLSQYSTESEDTITRPALINSLDRPHLFPDTPPGFQQDAERRPLLPLISPQVSPLVTSFLSPRLNQPPEPFPSLSPDIEPGFAPSDSSYEGLDVFGGHRPRRRWDLGLRSARGGGEQLWESRTFEQLHACSLVYFFIMFVVIVVGGGMLLVWGLLHQEG